jgi:hypothetical protein
MAAEVVLRQRVCRCGTTFYICRSCDRGQRYCSEHCRQKARREQCRKANRRHQQSLEGRLDHRDRQQLYRERLRLGRVTDQGSLESCSSGTMPRETTEHQQPPASALDLSLAVCVRCGRAGYAMSGRMEVDVSETTEALARPKQQEYVRTLLSAYVAMPETPSRWHSMDRRIALELFCRRIPVEVIQTALVLGSARRLARDPKRSVPPIRCLAYFLPIIDEVIAQPPPRDYIQYLQSTRIGPAQKASWMKSNTT